MKSAFMEQVRFVIRLRGYRPKTEMTYLYSLRQYIYFNNKIHQAECMALRDRG